MYLSAHNFPRIDIANLANTILILLPRTRYWLHPKCMKSSTVWSLFYRFLNYVVFLISMTMRLILLTKSAVISSSSFASRVPPQFCKSSICDLGLSCWYFSGQFTLDFIVIWSFLSYVLIFHRWGQLLFIWILNLVKIFGWSVHVFRWLLWMKLR